MTTPRTTSRRAPILGVVLIAVAVLGGAALWYVFFRPSGPPPVSLGSMAPATAAPAGSDAAGSGGTAGTGPGASAGRTLSPPERGALNQAWRVVPAATSDLRKNGTTA